MSSCRDEDGDKNHMSVHWPYAFSPRFGNGPRIVPLDGLDQRLILLATPPVFPFILSSIFVVYNRIHRSIHTRLERVVTVSAANRGIHKF